MKLANSWTMLTSSLLLTVLAYRWWGAVQAVVTLPLALLMPLHVWIGNSLFAEPLLQMLWLATLYAWSFQALYPRFSGLTTGLCLGLTFFVKMDALFLIPVVVAGTVLSRRLHPQWTLCFFVTSSLLLSIAANSWWHFNLFYWQTSLSTLSVTQWIGATIAIAIFVLSVYWLGKEGEISDDLTLTKLFNYSHPFHYRIYIKALESHGRLILCIVLLLLALYGAGIRPFLSKWMPHFFPWDRFYYWPVETVIRSYREETLLRLGWYWTNWGSALALTSISIGLFSIRKQWQVSLWMIGIISSIAIGYDIHNNPLQPYCMRRFVPFALPLFILGVLSLATLLGERLDYYIKSWMKTNPFLRQHMSSFAWIPLSPLYIVTLFLILSFCTMDEKLNTVANFGGLIPQLKTISDYLPPNAIVLIPEPSSVTSLATPLQLLFGHPTLLFNEWAQDDPAMDRLITSWQREGNQVYLLDEDLSTTSRTLPLPSSSITSVLPSPQSTYSDANRNPYQTSPDFKGTISVIALPESAQSLLLHPVNVRISYLIKKLRE